MIYFHPADISFRVPHARVCRQWLEATAQAEGKQIAEINYIFCSDTYLHQINMDYLAHDTYTDVITFELNEADEPVQADIFISVERIRDNAKKYSSGVLHELHRVMVHGLLHLCGYKDKSKDEQQEMRAREDYYLSLRPEKLKHWR